MEFRWWRASVLLSSDVLAVTFVAPKVTSASFLSSMTVQMSLFAVDGSNLIASFFEMAEHVF